MGGQNHNFRHLQVPFNIFETGIFTNISENDQCVLDIAQENGIQVYVNRVLHSLPPSGLWVGKTTTFCQHTSLESQRNFVHRPTIEF